MSGCGQELLPDDWECSGGPPVCLVVVESPSQESERGREVLPDVQEWSGGPPGYL